MVWICDEERYIGQRMLEMELPGRTRWGSPQRRSMDVVQRDMEIVGVRVEETGDRVRWRKMMRFGIFMQLTLCIGH